VIRGIAELSSAAKPFVSGTPNITMVDQKIAWNRQSGIHRLCGCALRSRERAGTDGTDHQIPSGGVQGRTWELLLCGVRVSDGASNELANAVRTSSGFDVTNPTDGTRYEVRPNVVNIISPNGQVDSEPMVQYASS
jgi:hypothetical protein